MRLICYCVVHSMRLYDEIDVILSGPQDAPV